MTNNANMPLVCPVMKKTNRYDDFRTLVAHKVALDHLGLRTFLFSGQVGSSSLPCPGKILKNCSPPISLNSTEDRDVSRQSSSTIGPPGKEKKSTQVTTAVGDR